MAKYTFYPLKLSILLFFFIFILSCMSDSPSGNGKISNNEKKFYSGKGIGPVKVVELGEINAASAATGKELFKAKCVTCHYIDDRKLIGPGMQGITLRRTPEWIMNQILNPIEMAQSDSLAKELLAIYYSQMTPMGLSVTEARNILEYFRILDSSPLPSP